MEEMAAQRYHFLQFLILAFIIILILVILIFILVYRCASKAKQNEIDSLKESFETFQIFSGTIIGMLYTVCTTYSWNHNCEKRTPDRSQYDSPMITNTTSNKSARRYQPR